MEHASKLLNVTKSKKKESSSLQINRSNVNAVLFGAKRLGKTAILNNLIKKPASQAATLSQKHIENLEKCTLNGISPHDVLLTVCNYVRGATGEGKTMPVGAETKGKEEDEEKEKVPAEEGKGVYLTLREVSDDDDAVDVVLSQDGEALKSDINLILYDPSDMESFEYACGILKRLPSHIPCVLLRILENGATASRDDPLGLPSLYQVKTIDCSIRGGDLTLTFKKIIWIALNP